MVSDLLLDITTDKFNHNDLQQKFDEVATQLLRQTKIVSGASEYLIKEIEFYFVSDHYRHLDPYTHKSPRQQLFAKWYFHRYKSPDTYTRQKFRGVDITFGNKRHNCFGGILIRKIENIKTHETIDGIGKIVSAIINDIGVAELDRQAKEESKLVFDSTSALRLEVCENSLDKPIYKDFRKGLGFPESDIEIKFWEKRYNYFNDANFLLAVA